MAILGVDDFKAKLRGGGARPNLFKATINFPAYAGGDVELTSFMCRAAQLPQSVVEATPVPFRGRVLNVAGDRSFEPWTVTILNDTGFEIRDAMERWMNGINGHSANTGIVNPVDYQTDLIIDQLDRDEKVIKRYNIRGAFPTTVGEIALSYDQGAEVETFDVTFTYQYWESNTTS
ncbi:phage tail protein [bacterium]|nr:phage tail protein [bacterium]